MTGQRGRRSERPRSGQRADRRIRPDDRRASPPVPDPARQAALDTLAAVRERSAYANLMLPALLTQRQLTGRDAALATELAYGTCRRLGQLDAVLAACADRDLAELDGAVIDALRLGANQLLHTRIPPHAALAATVDLVKGGPAWKAAGFVNAVLRRLARQDLAAWVDDLATDEIGRLALANAHPRWIVTAFSDALGPDRHELAQMLAADDMPPMVHLVARPGRISTQELADQAAGTRGRFAPTAVYLSGGHPGHITAVADSRAAVQDEGSQLVTLALANAALTGSDRRWLDLAAGPGGKAGLLGALAATRAAHLDAVEIAPHRAELVRRTTAELPVTVFVADGRDPDLSPGSYDRVLLDAPCSGLGALRRRPEARWRRTVADIAELVVLQRQLLASAARLVRPGGLVGYVTCSPHLTETAGVIGRAPAELELIDARPYLPGVTGLGSGPAVQLWPHRHGTDAMYLALLRRREPEVG